MSRLVRRGDIVRIAQDGRRVGEVLMHRCRCRQNAEGPGQSGLCIIGEHIDRATRDLAPGLRASNTDPKVRAWPSETDEDPPPDPTAPLNDRYRTLLQNYRDASAELMDFVQLHRPDRTVPPPETTSDSEYCRNHLQVLGECVPRYRGDLCRDCYEFHQIYRLDAPRSLLEVKREGRRWTQQLVETAAREARKQVRRRRRRTA